MNPVVETNTGKVRGFERSGLKIFLGIPFAAPPVGHRRWLAPQPVAPWTGIRATENFGPVAPQIKDTSIMENPLDASYKIDMSLGTEPAGNEDCLYLNIWSSGLDNDRRPVMVWIHGGGFSTGTGSSALYNGGVLAGRGNVVVVTINYRLNIFGFLRLKDITQGGIPSTGNEGILDQIAALKWIHDNIESFGGDPNNVTVFGQSAGGASISGLLGLSSTKGIFNKAICQSGSYNSFVTLDEANRYSEYLLHRLNLDVSQAKAIRSLTSEQLLDAYINSFPLPKDIRSPFPVVDGEIFLKPPIESINAGSADGIPLLAGTTLDEWRAWLIIDPALRNLNEAHMLKRLNRMMPNSDIAGMVEKYRRLLVHQGVTPTPSEIYLRLMSARLFWIPTFRMLEAQGHWCNSVYNYMLAWKWPFQGGNLRACHGIDIGFIWNAYQVDSFGLNSGVNVLSTNMQEAWLAFTHSGNPSCKTLGVWPAYRMHRKTVMLDKEYWVEESPFEEERHIWDSTPDDALRWR